MNALIKRRQQIQRDATAFEVTLWFVLNEIYGQLNYGPKRMQRLYDGMLDLLYDNKDDVYAGEILRSWAEQNGLTPEDYLARKAAKAEKADQERS